MSYLVNAAFKYIKNNPIRNDNIPFSLFTKNIIFSDELINWMNQNIYIVQLSSLDIQFADLTRKIFHW